jgi:hypothetical protein
MNRRRVGEDRGSKEMDGCPLTALVDFLNVSVLEHVAFTSILASSFPIMPLCKTSRAYIGEVRKAVHMSLSALSCILIRGLICVFVPAAHVGVV